MTVVVVALGVAALPAQAQLNINVTVAPPAPRYEPVPALPSGFAWAPGYWAWNGGRYDWVGGHQIEQRQGYRWVADHWEPGNRYRAGYWAPEREEWREGGHKKHHKHDRDHDNGNGNGNGNGFCPPGQAKKGNC